MAQTRDSRDIFAYVELINNINNKIKEKQVGETQC